MSANQATAPRASLAITQATLASALASGTQPWPDLLLSGVVPGGTLDVAGALAVYRSGYLARLTEQLGETYQAVWRVVGDESFLALAEAYIAGHASTSYNLSDYGRSFAEFLEGRGETMDPPFLPELARLELAFHDLFHAEAHEAVDAAALASIGDLSGVRLRFGRAVRLLDCRRAVYDLFRHRHDDEAPDLETERPQRVLMYRKGGDVLARELDSATFAALEALSSGRTVDEALEKAVETDGSFGAAGVSRLFETIALCGLVAGWER
jgi:hypothetical protein